jgi:N-methylhydantoinase A
LTPLAQTSPAEVNDLFDALAAQALAQLGSDGFAADAIRIERALDMRYAGQGYELSVACATQPIEPTDLAELRITFDAQHKAMFSHTAPQEPVEIVSYRVRGIGLLPPVELPKFKPAGTRLGDAWRGQRRVRFEDKEMDCCVYARERLDVGLTLAGPAILDQLDSTTLICPGEIARVDEWKNIVVTQAR